MEWRGNLVDRVPDMMRAEPVIHDSAFATVSQASPSHCSGNDYVLSHEPTFISSQVSLAHFNPAGVHSAAAGHHLGARTTELLRKKLNYLNGDNFAHRDRMAIFITLNCKVSVDRSRPRLSLSF